jgi:hypothetical protein
MCRNGTYTTFLQWLSLVLEDLSAGLGRFLPVVPELEGDAEVVTPEDADDVLQLVL